MKRLRWALAALAMLGGIEDTSAGTATANLRIQATVLSTCTVVGNTLDFGQVGQTTQRPQTNINVTCTKAAAFQVGINDGSHALSGQRRMQNDVTTTEFLSYELYKSLTGTDRFGDSIVAQRVSGVGNGSTPVIVPVFGEILTGQNPTTGQYVDNAIITVYF